MSCPGNFRNRQAIKQTIKTEIMDIYMTFSHEDEPCICYDVLWSVQNYFINHYNCNQSYGFDVSDFFCIHKNLAFFY